LGTGVPRFAKSSISHNLNKATLIFLEKKEEEKGNPEGETAALVAFESYLTGILTSVYSSGSSGQRPRV